ELGVEPDQETTALCQQIRSSGNHGNPTSSLEGKPIIIDADRSGAPPTAQTGVPAAKRPMRVVASIVIGALSVCAIAAYAYVTSRQIDMVTAESAIGLPVVL